MHRGHEHQLRVVADARAEFLEHGADGVTDVRDLVAASWRRSLSAGVPADDYRITYHEDVDVDSRLVRCARPVIDRLSDEMLDVPAAIALSDAQARIVHRRDCATSVGRPLDRVDFNAGFSFAEGGVGTNGIGTVFETGSSVAVVGAEHFTEALVRFACTGAPILDPVTGRVEGVLDVSSLAEDWTPLMHTLVRRAAADIGRNLLLDRHQATQALFETFVKADSRPRQAVMAVGDSLMVNQRAQRLFTPDEQQAIHQHALFLMSRRDRVSESLTLGSGRTVRLRATRILAGDQVAGMVLLLDDEPAPGAPAGLRPGEEEVAASRHRRAAAPERRRRRSRIVAGGTSPVWVEACDRISDALAQGDRLLVLGEPGTGRSATPVELFRAARPAGRVVTVGVRDPLPADALDDVRRLLTRTGTETGTDTDTPALVVLRHLDSVAGGDDVARLRAVLVACDHARAAGAELVVVATLDEASIGTGLPVEGLLGHFQQAVTLPPLRFRTDDLPLVLDRILRELAPGRPVRLHVEARRLLVRYGWPQNVTQLREALRHALQRRPVGEIRPDDLPAWCRTTGNRTLTTLERAERDTIVDVLQQCLGNRMHAAARLGMSRSSLYRKIKVFGIVDA